MIARLKREAPQRQRIVIALGGNALLPPGESGEIQEQFAYTRQSLDPVVELARSGWTIAIVHGNGPQIGDELLRNESARSEIPPLPLGVLVPATAGWIGYMIQQSLQNALAARDVDRTVATLITQVLVDPEHPASREPVKPIGRVMRESVARRLADDLGWSVGPASGGWRRLVPSPLPRAIVERDEIRRLVRGGTITIAAGGGGTPVYRDERGLEGIDGVVDKDRAAEMLARDIDAEVLLILTNVEGVYRAYGSPEQELMPRLTANEADGLREAGVFDRGGMEPKVQAAIDFVRAGPGRRAHIAHLNQGLAAVKGEAGTTITA